MCEKKTVLSVVLGVAIVALISSIVAAAIDGFTLLFDYKVLFRGVTGTYGTYYRTVSVLEIVSAVIAIAFAVALVVVSILAKNKRGKLILIIVTTAVAIVAIAYFVITVIVLRSIIPASKTYGSVVKALNYTMFTAYLANVASLTVSLVLSAVALLLLACLKSKRNAEKADVCGNSNTAEQTENNITE